MGERVAERGRAGLPQLLGAPPLPQHLALVTASPQVLAFGAPGTVGTVSQVAGMRPGACMPPGDFPSQLPGAAGSLRVVAAEAPPTPRCCPQVGEARALYNIGNVYHAKGKQLSWNAAQDPGHLPPDVRETLRRASEFYE